MAQIVVIGLGRFGSHVARTLHRSGDEVLAIDSDPEQVERWISPRTRAIVPVHYAGHSAEMGPLLEIAERRGVRPRRGGG